MLISLDKVATMYDLVSYLRVNNQFYANVVSSFNEFQYSNYTLKLLQYAYALGFRLFQESCCIIKNETFFLFLVIFKSLNTMKYKSKAYL